MKYFSKKELIWLRAGIINQIESYSKAIKQVESYGPFEYQINAYTDTKNELKQLKDVLSFLINVKEKNENGSL